MGIKQTLVSIVLGVAITVASIGNEERKRESPSYKDCKIVFVSDRHEEGDWAYDIDDEIYIMNADGSNQKRLTENPYDDAYPCWSPDGKKIAFVSFNVERADGVFSSGDREIHVVNPDGTELETWISTGGKNISPQWSPDGKKIAFLSDFEICVTDIELARRNRFYQRTTGAKAEYVRWSPDGKKIAFISDKDENFEIYVMDADGTELKNLTSNLKHDTTFCWSPDSKKIAFTSYRSGGGDIYVINSDGTELKNLTNNPDADFDPVYSPDGKKIAFISYRDKNKYGAPNKEVYVMNADGTEQKNLTNSQGGDGDPQWSPDGKKIVFVSDRVVPESKGMLNLAKIYVMNADGSNVQLLTHPKGIEHYFQPVWSPMPLAK